MNAMLYRWLADAVALLHFTFAVFVVLGGLLVLRRPRLAWLHLPVVCWGVLIEYAGWICPLTPLENSLRRRGGGAGYTGGFIDHYITAVLYPAGLTRGAQAVLGSVALLINVAVYWRLVRGRSAPGSRSMR